MNKFLRDAQSYAGTERRNRKQAVYHHPCHRIDKAFVFATMTPEWGAQFWRQVYEQLYLARGAKAFFLGPLERDYAEKINEASGYPYQRKPNFAICSIGHRIRPRGEEGHTPILRWSLTSRPQQTR